MDNRPIGMFDSGVGGITVFQEVRKKLPNEDIIYIGDTASFPYGSKSKETIIELTKKRIEDLIQKNVKLIVIACGTATSQALEEVKKLYDVPIIGIIEPTIEYLQKKNYHNIGVIATTGTIRSKGWQKAINDKIPNCLIQAKACPLLAPMAEEGWIENEIAKLTVHEYMKEMKNVEALILGCTHYPLFRELIVSEVELYIQEHNLKNMKNSEANYQIYLTDTECNFIEVAKILLKDEDIVRHIQKI